MIYYRIAVQLEPSSFWQWLSSTLTSASSVIDFLKKQTHIPQAAIRVFFSSSPVSMDEMLTRTNNGLIANSVTAAQFLQEGCLSLAEIKRLELELNTRGDHDCPYMFALPASMSQVLAWTKLLARVYNGELKP